MEAYVLNICLPINKMTSYPITVGSRYPKFVRIAFGIPDNENPSPMTENCFFFYQQLSVPERLDLAY